MKAILLHIVSKTVAHIMILESMNHLLGFLRTGTAVSGCSHLSDGFTPIWLFAPSMDHNSLKERVILLISVRATGTVPGTRYVLSIACRVNT